MKLNIAFLQLLPTGSLTGNMEKGIKACREAKERGADIANGINQFVFLRTGFFM